MGSAARVKTQLPLTVRSNVLCHLSRHAGTHPENTALHMHTTSVDPASGLLSGRTQLPCAGWSARRCDPAGNSLQHPWAPALAPHQREVSCQCFCRTVFLVCMVSSGGGLQTAEGTCMGNNSKGTELLMCYVIAHTALNVGSGSGLLIELLHLPASAAEVACRPLGRLRKQLKSCLQALKCHLAPVLAGPWQVICLQAQPAGHKQHNPLKNIKSQTGSDPRLPPAILAALASAYWP